MKTDSPRTRLKHEFRRLFRCMDFIARQPALDTRAREARRFAETYQQLGLAWEFLALRCRHWDGFRRTRDGNRVCRICGTLHGTGERWVLRRAESAEKRTVPETVSPRKHDATPSRRARGEPDVRGDNRSQEALRRERNRP